MEQSLQDQVQKRLAELPEDVRRAIQSSDLGMKIQGVAKKHKLHIDQEGKLEDETLLVMLGFADPGDFADQISKGISVSLPEAEAISAEIVNEVFMPIRESMKAWAANRKGTEAPAPAPTASVPATQVSTPSVVMPSSSTPVVPAIPVPTPIVTPAPTPTPVSAPKPAVAPNLAAADAILSEKKVTPPIAPPAPATPPSTVAAPATPAVSLMPKVDPAQPQNYKADPYREPVE